MNFLQPIGRVFLAFLGTAGRLTLAADDNLHPSEKVYTPWVALVPLAESALLEEETS